MDNVADCTARRFSPMRFLGWGIIALFAGMLSYVSIHFASRIWPQSREAQIEQQVASSWSKPIKGATVLFGDSQIANLRGDRMRLALALRGEWLAFRARNWGISGETVEQLSSRVSRYQLTGAKRVIVEVGINNLMADKFARFGEKYLQLLKQIPQRVPVIAISIAPLNRLGMKQVKATGLKYNSRFTINFSDAQRMIVNANREIQMACQRRLNCRFSDIARKFQPPGTKEADPRFLISDGLHLSAKGYGLLFTSIE